MKLPRAFWAWDEIVEMNKTGYWPYTPNTNLLYRLAEACDMLLDPHFGGLQGGIRAAPALGRGRARGVKAWGLEVQCNEAASQSPVLTGVIMPEGVDADAVRKLIYERFDLSLGTGLGKVKGRMFPHRPPGRLQRPDPDGGLSGCEMGLKLSGVKLSGSGVAAAMEFFAGHPAPLALQKRQQPRLPPPLRRETTCNVDFRDRRRRDHRAADGPRPAAALGPGAHHRGLRPGGGTDILSRDRRSPYDVEHAGHRGEQGRRLGTIAADYVSKQPADGTVLHMAHINSHAIVPNLQKLGYDAEKDFQPIAMVGVTPNLLICGQMQPAKTVKDLVALCKANPGKVSFGSAGPGSAQHLALEMFMLQAGVKAIRAVQGLRPDADRPDRRPGAVQLRHHDGRHAAREERQGRSPSRRRAEARERPPRTCRRWPSPASRLRGHHLVRLVGPARCRRRWPSA